MQLHTLEMQAFGPFAQTAEIDFEQLGDSPLFLIDGPTGAGKSSILHAICYALYGETTDSARKEIGLRCDHAKDELLTQVSLTFSIGKQKYRIERIPTQQRKQKRGEGFTEQKSQAHLLKIDEDGSEQTLVAKKKTEADERIKQIIGLSAEQFRQVMVLPQGKFRELLLAKSDERQAIFSTLFQTEIYKHIEQILKDKAASIEREYKRFEERIHESLSEVQVADVEQLQAKINSEAQQGELLSQQKQLAETVKQQAHNELQAASKLAELFSQQTQKQQQLTAHHEQRKTIAQMQEQLHDAQKAAKIDNVYQTLQQLQSDVDKQKHSQQQVTTLCEQQQKKVVEDNKAYTKAEQQYQQRDAVLAELEQLKVYASRWQTLQQHSSHLKQCQQNVEQANQQIEQLTKQHEELVTRSQKGEVYVNELEQQIAQIATIQLSINQQGQRVDLLTGLQQHTTEQQNLEQQCQQTQQTQLTCQQAYLQAEQSANHLEQQWVANQAAVLATTLQDQQPCPVCGSSQHPMPAHQQADHTLVNKEQIEQARANQQSKQQELHKQNTLLAKLQQSLQLSQQQGQQLTQQLGDDGHLDLATEQQQLANLQAQLTQLNALQAKLQPAKDKLASMQAKITPVEAQIAQVQQNLPHITEQAIIAQTEQQNLLQGIEEAYRVPGKIEQGLNEKQQQLSQLEQQWQSAQQVRSQSETQLTALSSQREEISKSLQQLTTRLDAQLQGWQSALEQSGFASQDAFANSRLNVEEHQRLAKQLEDYNRKGTELNSQLSLLADQLEAKSPPDVTTQQDKTSKADEQALQAQKAWSDQQVTLAKLTGVAEKVTQLETEQGTNKAQYEVVGTMAKAAAGRGNVRVSLERFVLADLLDRVLTIASKRLHIMSKGQYQLVRQNEDQQKRNVTAGLDLAINDAYTGKTRPVATLSGGESFLASLSLALGLSDVVQQQSGGIKLDTLFIDEGFGSLDQESLQLAIQTLIDLQQSGRSIGIISHVSELKEQMALRINVTSTNHGSHVQTICDY